MLLENGAKLRKEKLCNLNAVEVGSHFLKDCPNYKKLREPTFKSIQHTEHIHLSRGNITKKLKKLFSNGSLWSLYVLGKFVQTKMVSRENSQTLAFISLISRMKIIILLIFADLLVYIFWFFYLCALSCWSFFNLNFCIHAQRQNKKV